MTDYSPLENKFDNDLQAPEDCERLLPNSTAPLSKQATPRLQLWASLVLGPILSLCMLGIGIWVGLKSANTNAVCAQRTQNYSPIQKEVDNAYHTVVFNGSLLKENVFRQDAGPEVDAAWESMGVNYRALTVPKSEAAKSRLTKPGQVQISQKYGGGFVANVEGLHHLHCLNLLRQTLYYNFDYYKAQGEGAFVNDDNILKHHVSHCLDIIRQQLMCTPDTGLLGQVWWDRESPRAFVDFNTEHKCKNFESIRQWAEERQIPETVPNDFLEPPVSREVVYEEIP